MISPHSMREYDLGQMSVIFAEAGVRFYARAQAGLSASARLILASAARMYGDYQPQVGPFPAWSPLQPETQEKRVQQGYTPDDPLLASGKMKNSLGMEVWGLEAAVGSTDEKQLWHELGAKNGVLPPRPVLGPAAFINRDRIHDILGNVALAGVMNVDLGNLDGSEINRPGYEARLAFDG